MDAIYARPIGFSQPMMAANMAGRKTQTRRLPSNGLGSGPWARLLYAFEKEQRPCVLWVKERVDRREFGAGVVARYTIDHLLVWNSDLTKILEWPFKTSFVTHIPRPWSRFVCVVKGVRAEPLQDISEADAIAEGIEPVVWHGETAWKSYETCPDGTLHPHAAVPNRSPVTSYRELWNSLHTKPGQRWEDNPIVWVIEYEWKAQRIEDLLKEAGHG